MFLGNDAVSININKAIFFTKQFCLMNSFLWSRYGSGTVINIYGLTVPQHCFGHNSFVDLYPH
jgi:hypothetical protein